MKRALSYGIFLVVTIFAIILIAFFFDITYAVVFPIAAGVIVGLCTGRRRTTSKTYPAMGIGCTAGMLQWTLITLPQAYKYGPLPWVVTAIALLLFVTMVAKAIEAEIAWAQAAYLTTWWVSCWLAGYDDMALLAVTLLTTRVGRSMYLYYRRHWLMVR